MILACSATKRVDEGVLPAVERYDGPQYRVLRNRLRSVTWPEELSVGVLSAEFGLMGGMTSIPNYDRRIDAERAGVMRAQVTTLLGEWGRSHDAVTLWLGEEYLRAVDLEALKSTGLVHAVVKGGIGEKLHQLRSQLDRMEAPPRKPMPSASQSRPLYFLPDWDDMLDRGFDFKTDSFSAPTRAERSEVHCIQAMRPRRICDGALVSLAQQFGPNSRGTLRDQLPDSVQSLAPQSMRKRFGLEEDQWTFGDCGSFSYVADHEPAISVSQAVSLYQIHGFDFGASVDHIPLPEGDPAEGLHHTEYERHRRVQLTKRLAADFINVWRQRRCTFTPVGVIQGTGPRSFASQLPEYADMGYGHVALGGLVPRSDAEILRIVQAVSRANALLRERLWIHLFGVFRPKIQPQMRTLGVDSFDSATYFRKAWLRSDQNYLASNGKWYAAIRVPMTADPRTLIRLGDTRNSLELQAMEKIALASLRRFDKGRAKLDDVLDNVVAYDALLGRAAGRDTADLRQAYERTLSEKPWRTCGCPVCADLGIDVMIFRGYNRNKRRGAHNTSVLYTLLGRTRG